MKEMRIVSILETSGMIGVKPGFKIQMDGFGESIIGDIETLKKFPSELTNSWIAKMCEDLGLSPEDHIQPLKETEYFK